MLACCLQQLHGSLYGLEYNLLYGITPKPTAQLADRFDTIIQTAYKQTGQQVAILIDEYDSPLQHSWKTPQHEACTSIYREVFAILKADDKYEKFVFITGITKFTQISLFSVLNNLSNISFEPEYAAICGITKEEVLRRYYNNFKNRITTADFAGDNDREAGSIYCNEEGVKVSGIDFSAKYRSEFGLGVKIDYNYLHTSGNTVDSQFSQPRSHSATWRIDYDRQVCSFYGLNVALSGRYLSEPDTKQESHDGAYQI